MKRITWKCFLYILFIFLFVDIPCIYGIHAFGEQEYSIFVQLTKGAFSVPVKERTRIQKNAVIKFWRSKERFTLNGNILYFDGKKVHFLKIYL